MRWRWAAASEIGTSHERLGTRKQDALACFTCGPDSRALISIVCDGAGSAPFGGEGASVVCRTLGTALREHFRDGFTLPTDQEIWSWVDLCRDRLGLAAERKGVTRKVFASTLVALVATSEEILCLHIGDGAIVARNASGAWEALSWPENGEYASTTYFMTDDPVPNLRIARLPSNHDGFAVMSDGIEDLALDLQQAIPHEPFFKNMLSPLDKDPGAGKLAALSAALGKFLSSPRVCEKTDDDKSLVLVSSQ